MTKITRTIFERIFFAITDTMVSLVLTDQLLEGESVRNITTNTKAVLIAKYINSEYTTLLNALSKLPALAGWTLLSVSIPGNDKFVTVTGTDADGISAVAHIDFTTDVSDETEGLVAKCCALWLATRLPNPLLTGDIPPGDVPPSTN